MLPAERHLPTGLSPEKFEKASQLLYEFEDADFPPNCESEGANLQRGELVIRLFEIFSEDGSPSSK